MYAESFRAFCDCTDEKSVLRSFIQDEMAREYSRSILDIGAGDGRLAIPIAKGLLRYTAVEPMPEYAAYLRENRIEVIEKEFPCKVPAAYDLVLSCHSLPGRPDEFGPFILEALKAVRPKGNLLIITYDDAKFDEVVRSCGLPWGGFHFDRVAKLESFFAEMGRRPWRAEIETSVASRDLEEVMHALAFVYSDGVPEDVEAFTASAKMRRYLAERCFTREKGYSFPFTHIAYRLEKASG